MARTEKILNGKLLFLCSVGSIFQMFYKIKGALILFCALFFWYVVFHTWNEYGNLLNSRIQSKMRGNTDEKELRICTLLKQYQCRLLEYDGLFSPSDEI